MERASRSLSKLGVKAMEIAGIRSYHLAPGAWVAAVGSRIAAKSRPAFLDGNKLVVEVVDAVWKAQLDSLSQSILERLDQVLGRGVIRSLEFRVAPPKRAPQRASAAVSVGRDEADGIEDPILRHLYQISRRRASA
ncbi:MAG: DUF721 domain-containing protein [Bryobacteraceae bacterium]|nr:DUF721 domain-containing protein [Bryobacteraceae bacterium]MDW8379912.1 DUF721 domain-containing protein [Bryobacterales bacterium]